MRPFWRCDVVQKFGERNVGFMFRVRGWRDAVRGFGEWNVDRGTWEKRGWDMFFDPIRSGERALPKARGWGDDGANWDAIKMPCPCLLLRFDI